MCSFTSLVGIGSRLQVLVDAAETSFATCSTVTGGNSVSAAALSGSVMVVISPVDTESSLARIVTIFEEK